MWKLTLGYRIWRQVVGRVGKNIENWSSGFVWVIYLRSLAFETVKTIYLFSQTILGINKHHTLIVVATRPLFKCEISHKYDK